jgi:predicted RND superfamily exporter protein
MVPTAHPGSLRDDRAVYAPRMRWLASVSLSRTREALLVLALATAVLGVGLARLRTEAGYRAFLGSGHPAIQRLDAFAARFGGGLPFAAVWSCAEAHGACTRVFDPTALRMADDLATRMSTVDGVRRVDGPASSPILTQPLFGLPEARRLVSGGKLAPDVEELASLALEDPLWVGQIVSADGTAGALLVHLASSENDVGVRAFEALRAAVKPWEARGLVYHFVGGPVEFVVAGQELARNSARLVPLMTALVGGTLWILFGSWQPAAAVLVSVGVAVLWTTGLQGWLGWPRNSLTELVAPLLLVIGVAEANHLVAHYAGVVPAGAGRRARADAFVDSAAVLGPACAVATLTTAAGFASFVTSPLASLARFGLVAAFGVMAALLASFTLLPVLIVGMQPPRASRARAERWQRALGELAAWSQRRAALILAVATLLGVAGAVGFARLQTEASFEDIYGRDSSVVRWAHAASRILREPETMDVALELPAGLAVDSADSMRLLAEAERLDDLDGIGRPLSILAPLRRLNQLLYREPLSLDAPAADPERPAQLLHLLARGDPALVDLFVDRSGGALRVSFQAEKLPQQRLRELLAEVDRRLAAALPPGARASVTGPLATVAELIDELRQTQLQSFATAGVLVAGLLGIFLRSLPTALLAMVPTVVPVLLTLGAMGFLGIALDVGSAMVAAVVLGLSDDNAVHLLTTYRRARSLGAPAPDAAIAAVRDEGRAVVTSSLALAAGFTVLGLAPWQSIASFGIVAAIAILASLAASLVLVPALLAVTGERARPRP